MDRPTDRSQPSRAGKPTAPVKVSSVPIKQSAERFPEIAGYQITGRLGEGGMGIVWSGVQLSTKRIVAIKLLSTAGFGSERSKARFAREVELAASLQHPNIARVYDSGLDRGVWFYAMELINGSALDRYVKKKRPSRREILALMRRVCLGMQHAHQRGVIHRDLKPSNILVTDDGQTHILDFGLAKEVGGDAKSNVSIQGDVAGTPAYMSPEQAAGLIDKIDTRTDVYSLGIILYRLLTGQTPHSLEGPHLEVMKRIAEDEVIRPRLAATDLDGEVDAILLKALAREPEERYSSAGAFGADLQNYLDGEPVTARSASTLYFLRKRFKKHRGRFAAASIAVLLLLATAVGAYVNVRAQRDRADQQAQIARAAVEKADQALVELQAKQQALEEETQRVKNALDVAQREKARADLQTQVAGKATESEQKTRIEFATSRQTILSARDEAAAQRDLAMKQREAASQDAQAANAAADLAKKAQMDVQSHQRESQVNLVQIQCQQATALMIATRAVESHALFEKVWDQAHKLDMPMFPIEMAMLECEARYPSPIAVLAGNDGSGYCFKCDGRFILSRAADDKSINVLDVITGRVLGTFTGHASQQCNVWHATISRSGRFAASGDTLGRLMLWSLPQGKLIREIPLNVQRIDSVAISPNEGQVAVAALDKIVRVFDVATGRLVWSGPGHTGQIGHLCYSADGRMLVSSSGIDSADDTIRVWNAGGALNRILKYPTGTPMGLDLSPDGKLIAAASTKKLIVYNVASGEPATTASIPDGSFNIAFSADAKLLLVGTAKGKSHLLDTTSGTNLRKIPGSLDRMVDCGFLPGTDLTWACSFKEDYQTILCNIRERYAINTIAAADSLSPTFSPDGRLIAAIGANQLNVWDSATNQQLIAMPCKFEPYDPIDGVRFIDSRRVLLQGYEALHVWDLVDGKEVFRIRKPKNTPDWAIATAPDCSRIALYEPDGTIQICDIQGHWLHQATVNGGVTCMAFLGDGKRLAVSHTGETAIVDTDTGQPQMALPVGARGAAALSDHELLLNENSGDFRIWNLETKSVTHQFAAGANQVASLAASGDGRRIITCGEDQVLRLWNPEEKTELYAFGGMNPAQSTVTLSKDGNYLLTQDSAGLHLWDLNRMAAHHDLQVRSQSARAMLQTEPNDPTSELALGQWYQLRGVWAWAAQLLESARKGGARVSSLSLARDYWQIGDARHASAEFQKALAGRETDEGYVRLCLNAMANPPRPVPLPAPMPLPAPSQEIP